MGRLGKKVKRTSSSPTARSIPSTISCTLSLALTLSSSSFSSLFRATR